MTILQLQLSEKNGYVLTKPGRANPADVKLIEGEFKVEQNKLMLNEVELATRNGRNLKLNGSVLMNAVGDIRQIVQQLRFFGQAYS
ncbi:hypothetical protein pEaSNUABM37_00214 [Erwinia phage pEa_SNUABM_37]|nr:hypothetical protein pEaSNUABM37_00214 [Erwinia phage pEa_SNUABM_37]QXO10684.1 hypothetical protein pEaSNUABM48_00214 [Erwinia phage pEa_SNUABM_48]